jgi:hypothetical protein
MDVLGLSRHDLADRSDYSYEYIRDRLTPSAPEPPKKFAAAMERLFAIVEREGLKDSPKPLSVWDRVYFDGAETTRIYEAARSAGYLKIEDLYHDAVMDYCDELLATDPVPVSEFPFPGSVAAGQPVEPERAETLKVASDLSPDNHAVFEINGESGGDEFKDGERWLVEIFPGEARTAKKGKPAVFRDKDGAYLKIYQGKGLPLRSVDPNHPDVVPSDGMELVGYPVERVKDEKEPLLKVAEDSAEYKASRKTSGK